MLNDMGMIINRRRVYSGGKKLPYDAKVEYLESAGGQYIKTDIIGTPSIDLYMDFQLLSPINEDRKLIGNNMSVGLAILGNHFRVVADTFYLSSSLADTNRHIFRTEGNVFYIDNVIIFNERERVSTTGKLLYIFAMSNIYNRPDGKCGIMKMYECKLFDNYALVRHFIPVRVGNVGYMYDKVSGQLFSNAGTGDFILGPDV